MINHTLDIKGMIALSAHKYMFIIFWGLNWYQGTINCSFKIKKTVLKISLFIIKRIIIKMYIL